MIFVETAQGVTDAALPLVRGEQDPAAARHEGVGQAPAGDEVVALGGDERPPEEGPSPTRRSTPLPRPSSEQALAFGAGGHVARHLVEAHLLELEALVVVVPEGTLQG